MVTRWYINKIIYLNYLITTVIRFISTTIHFVINKFTKKLTNFHFSVVPLFDFGTLSLGVKNVITLQALWCSLNKVSASNIVSWRPTKYHIDQDEVLSYSAKEKKQQNTWWYIALLHLIWWQKSLLWHLAASQYKFQGKNLHH